MTRDFQADRPTAEGLKAKTFAFKLPLAKTHTAKDKHAQAGQTVTSRVVLAIAMLGGIGLVTFVATLFTAIAIFPVIQQSDGEFGPNSDDDPLGLISTFKANGLGDATSVEVAESTLLESAFVHRLSDGILLDVGDLLDAKTQTKLASVNTLDELEALQDTIAAQVPNYADIDLIGGGNAKRILDAVLNSHDFYEGSDANTNSFPNRFTLPSTKIHRTGVIGFDEEVSVVIPENEIYTFEYEVGSAETIVIHAHNFGLGEKSYADPYILLYSEKNKLIDFSDDSMTESRYDARIVYHGVRGQRISFDVGNLQKGKGKVSVRVIAK